MTKAFWASNNRDAAKIVITNSKLKCKLGPSMAKVSKLSEMTSTMNNSSNWFGIRTLKRPSDMN